MQTVQEFKPRRRRFGSRKTWRSKTLNITLPLEPNLLGESAQGYETATLLTLLKDLSHDLQQLKADRSSLMQWMHSNKSTPPKIAAEVARIDKNRIPMAKAWTALNAIICERRSTIPSWHKFFFEAAKCSLDQKTLNTLKDQATRLHEECLCNVDS
jgi:hypothetical protein